MNLKEPLTLTKGASLNHDAACIQPSWFISSFCLVAFCIKPECVSNLPEFCFPLWPHLHWLASALPHSQLRLPRTRPNPCLLTSTSWHTRHDRTRPASSGSSTQNKTDALKDQIKSPRLIRYKIELRDSPLSTHHENFFTQEKQSFERLAGNK